MSTTHPAITREDREFFFGSDVDASVRQALMTDADFVHPEFVDRPAWIIRDGRRSRCPSSAESAGRSASRYWSSETGTSSTRSTATSGRRLRQPVRRPPSTRSSTSETRREQRR